jgi:peptide/nickel transport system substrate-binding protein
VWSNPRVHALLRGPRAPLRAAALIALLCAAGLLTGCHRAAQSPKSDSLTLAVRADVTGFFPNPPIVNEGYTQDINWNIFEGLSAFDGQYRLMPALAERWHNPDDRTYVFELRPDLRFSDGSPVTADDVVASLEAHLARGWVFNDYLQSIETVRAEGEQRVVIRTRFPYLILLFKLPWGMVLPRAALARHPAPPIGTGPYRLESWTPGQGFVLQRNVHYRGPAPAYDTARFLVEPDASRRLAMLRDGRADVVDHVPFDAIADLETSPDLRVYAGAGNRVLFLGMRTDREPFSDPRVREALDLAIDREQLIDRVFGGRAQAASQVVPRSVAGFNPRIPVTRADRPRARRLLLDAGFAKGLAVRLDGPNNRYVRDEQLLEEVARQLAEVGVQVEVRAADKAEYFRKLEALSLDFFVVGWACQGGEAGEALDPLFHSQTRPGLGGENFFGLADAELDRLIDAANASTRQADRLANLQAALGRIAELRPMLALAIQPEAVAMSRRVVWDPPANYAFRLDSLRPARD